MTAVPKVVAKIGRARMMAVKFIVGGLLILVLAGCESEPLAHHALMKSDLDSVKAMEKQSGLEIPKQLHLVYHDQLDERGDLEEWIFSSSVSTPWLSLRKLDGYTSDQISELLHVTYGLKLDVGTYNGLFANNFDRGKYQYCVTKAEATKGYVWIVQRSPNPNPH